VVGRDWMWGGHVVGSLAAGLAMAGWMVSQGDQVEIVPRFWYAAPVDVVGWLVQRIRTPLWVIWVGYLAAFALVVAGFVWIGKWRAGSAEMTKVE